VRLNHIAENIDFSENLPEEFIGVRKLRLLLLLICIDELFNVKVRRYLHYVIGFNLNHVSRHLK